MRKTAVLLLAALSACATTTPADRATGTAPRTATIHQSGTPLQSRLFVELPSEYSAVTEEIPAPPAQAWQALVNVYGDLGIPVTSVDQATRQIGNAGFDVKRQMAGQPVSRWLDCGRGAGGVIRADRDRIHALIISTIIANPDGSSTVRTGIQARAHDESANANNAVPCTSNGMLERHIATRVKTRLDG